MNPDMELRAQRRQTSAFIAANRIKIILTPVTRTKTAGGGTIDVPQEPRPEQDFRLVTASTAVIVRPNASQTGIAPANERSAEGTLYGEHDADVAVGDYWDDDSGRWKVITLQPPNGYEVVADVERHRAGS